MSQTQIQELKQQIYLYQLQNKQILDKYTDTQLCYIYNGIGPAAFPDWLRLAISALHPALNAVALIHDIEWHQTDRNYDTFTESNRRFKRNGYKVAKLKYKWYDPRRYIVLFKAYRFGNICQTLGWFAYDTQCSCDVCKGAV